MRATPRCTDPRSAAEEIQAPVMRAWAVEPAPSDDGVEDLTATRILAEAAGLFARGGSEQILEGVVRILVRHVSDWCLVVPRPRGRNHDGPVLGIRRSEGGAPAHELDGVEVTLGTAGIGALLPATQVTWGEDAAVELVTGEGPLVLPAACFGVFPLAGGRLRFGTLVVGVSTSGRVIGPAERVGVGAVVAAMIPALENAELARSSVRASQSRDTVFDVVTHDLMTPLSSISLLLDRIVAAAPVDDGGGRIHNYVAGAKKSLGQVQRLISDLADVRDIEMGMFHSALSPQPVCGLLGPAVHRAGPLAADLGVAIQLEDDACPLTVLADPARVTELVGHLLGRAIRVSPRGGRVVVHPRFAGDRVEVTVSDEGPGLSPYKAQHLFGRAAQARGHDGGRRGLGLMIAQEIARAHGEPLRVETVVGGGSRLTFSLSLAP